MSQPQPHAHPARLLDEAEVKRIFERFAYQFTEAHERPDDIAIIGMQRRGVFIGQRVRRIIKEQSGVEVPFGVLD
ncbi:MAG: hypothetical protein ACOC2C_08795, partial [Cyclonatronaceae bacterium]